MDSVLQYCSIAQWNISVAIALMHVHSKTYKVHFACSELCAICDWLVFWLPGHLCADYNDDNAPCLITSHRLMDRKQSGSQANVNNFQESDTWSQANVNNCQESDTWSQANVNNYQESDTWSQTYVSSYQESDTWSQTNVSCYQESDTWSQPNVSSYQENDTWS